MNGAGNWSKKICGGESASDATETSRSASEAALWPTGQRSEQADSSAGKVIQMKAAARPQTLLAA